MSVERLAFTSLVLLTTASTARADALTDFEEGSTVLVTVAEIEADAGIQTLSGGGPLEKRSGSVDLEIPAAHLGLDLPVTLHLRGTTSPGGHVEYSIDEAFREPIDIDGAFRLTRVTGHLSMRAFALPGTVAPEVGSMYLAIADRSYLVVTGDLGELTLPVTKLVVQGGLLQPPLASFVDASRTLPCSDRVATRHTFEVSLTEDARGDGALVRFTTEPGAGVLLPGGVFVAAGRRSVAIDAHVEPDFVGPVRLSAAAGGIQRTIDLEVHPARDCAR